MFERVLDFIFAKSAGKFILTAIVGGAATLGFIKTIDGFEKNLDRKLNQIQKMQLHSDSIIVAKTYMAFGNISDKIIEVKSTIESERKKSNEVKRLTAIKDSLWRQLFLLNYENMELKKNELSQNQNLRILAD